MSGQTLPDKPPTSAQVLDLLLDALLERQAARRKQAHQPVPDGERPVSQLARAPTALPKRPAPPTQRRPFKPRAPRRKPGPGDEGWEPPPRLPSINVDRVLLRFVLLIAVLVLVANVPVNQYGISLARIMPDSASLIVRDGLILKGSGPEIYRVEDGRLRWISSLDAFEHLGLKWGDVHVVEDQFLNRFEEGRPIHVLLKCPDSPHVYRLENQEKRWVKDIDTFVAEGHVWDDVRFVGCDYLRQIPDGPSIPPDAGPPPQL